MKNIDVMIKERAARLAVIGENEPCPQNHSPNVTHDCPACDANGARAFLRAVVEMEFCKGVEDDQRYHRERADRDDPRGCHPSRYEERRYMEDPTPRRSRFSPR